MLNCNRAAIWDLVLFCNCKMYFQSGLSAISPQNEYSRSKKERKKTFIKQLYFEGPQLLAFMSCLWDFLWPPLWMSYLHQWNLSKTIFWWRSWPKHCTYITWWLLWEIRLSVLSGYHINILEELGSAFSFTIPIPECLISTRFLSSDLKILSSKSMLFFAF